MVMLTTIPNDEQFEEVVVLASHSHWLKEGRNRRQVKVARQDLHYCLSHNKTPLSVLMNVYKISETTHLTTPGHFLFFRNNQNLTNVSGITLLQSDCLASTSSHGHTNTVLSGATFVRLR